MSGPKPSKFLPIRNRGSVDLDVLVPGSKSIANRSLLLASLAEGRSTIRNVPEGDDVRAMVASLVRLGALIEVEGSSVHVIKPLPLEEVTPVEVNAGLAGTTSRFLVACSALRTGPVTVRGDGRLADRPFGELIEALRALGGVVEGGPGLPLIVRRGEARGGSLHLSGSVSSQFVSALMMIGPLLSGGIAINVTGSLVSASYVRMTESLMRQFGAEVEFVGNHVDVVQGRYVGQMIDVEPDASSMSYPVAAVAIAGGRARLREANRVRLQSDRRIFDIVEEMGCVVETDGQDVVVSRSPSSTLKSVDVDLREESDLVPTVAVLGAVASGTTRIRGVGFVRNKESDRISDLAFELRRFGAIVQEADDGLDVEGGSVHGASVDPHDDHRLAMALGVLGLVASGTRIENPDVVSKSWPRFFEALDLV